MEQVYTFAEIWSQYCESEMPQDLPAAVRIMFEQTFYAGAASALRSVDTIARTADSPVEGMAAMSVLKNEVSEFQAREVKQILELLFEKQGMNVDVHIVQMKDQ